MDKLVDKEISSDFISSAYHLREFLNDSVWKDISAEIEAVIGNARTNLEVINNMTEIARFQGRIEALRYILMLPESILDHLESLKREDEDE